LNASSKRAGKLSKRNCPLWSASSKALASRVTHPLWASAKRRRQRFPFGH
jgi:hypothetical protein